MLDINIIVVLNIFIIKRNSSNYLREQHILVDQLVGFKSEASAVGKIMLDRHY